MFVSHPLVKEDSVKLRLYQEQIVANAIEKNTLVVLPTGLGKTMVAAMVAAHQLQRHPSSMMLFLAPTRPLVMQHYRTFKDLIKIDDSVVLTGMDSVDKRKTLWTENKLVFATPQTIENDLMRGLDLSDISLIVFDEAHRAVGDYAYKYIAEEYMKKARNPLILGLTASPSSDKTKVDEICSNLSIEQIEAKTEKDVDVKPYIQEVDTEWVKVELPDEFKKIKKMIEDVLRDDLRQLKKLQYLDTASMNKINKKTLLKLQSTIRQEITSGLDSYQAASLVASVIKINHAIELLETQGLSALDAYFQRLGQQKSKAVKRLLADKRMNTITKTVHDLSVLGLDHPKLERLVEIVEEHKDDKVLIFTQYRDSVNKIIDVLNRHDVLAHEFIGQASRGSQQGMSQKKQIEVLDKFRAGEFTALIATSVAEEGLDIPKVDVVVFYEPIPSEIRSIQRRGRTGRSATGKVIVLMAKGTRDEGYYWASVHKERKMRKIVDEMRDQDYNGENQQTLVSYADEEEDTGVGEADNEQVSYGQKSMVEYGFTEGEELKIYVDVRERNSRIMKALRDKALIEVKQLPVGDYILSDRVCVERKTIDDFIQSIIDNRLLGQARELVRNFEAPAMIIEGEFDKIYSRRMVHPNAIRGALASLALDYRISIIPSRDEEDTAKILHVIARREQELDERLVALRGEKKPLMLRERQLFVVESLPNVSAVLARRLLDKFGSVEKVVTASTKELMEVEGIGDKKAEEITKVVKNKYQSS